MHTLKLAEWRQFRGLTKSALAARAGVSFLTIWRMESGRSRSPQRETMERLAAALDAEPRHLWATPPSAKTADSSQSSISALSAAAAADEVRRNVGEITLER